MDFRKLISVRDSLTSIAAKNNAFVAEIVSESIADASAIGSGQSLGISYSRDANGSVTFQTTGNDPITFNKNAIMNNLGTVIPGSSYTVSDVLQDVSSTGDVYNTLSAITSKFSYSERMTLTDINQLIDRTTSNVNGMDYSIGELQDQLVTMCDSDGYITCHTWLTSLQSWMSACKGGCDNASPELDNTAPNALTSVYNVVAGIVSNVLSTIFVALSSVFGALSAVIGAAVSGLMSLVSSVVEASITMNPSAPNLFAKGVAISKQFPYGYSIGLAEGYSIRYTDLPSVASFHWRGDSNNQVKMNAYVRPLYSFTSVAYTLGSLSSSEKEQLGFNWDISFNSWQQDYFELNGWRSIKLAVERMGDSEMNLCSYDPVFWAACVCVSEFVRFMLSAPYKIPGQTGTGWVNNKVSNYSRQNMGTYPTVVAIGWLLVRNGLKGQSYLTDLSTGIICDAVNHYLVQLYNDRERFDDTSMVSFYDSAAVHFQYCSNPLIVSNRRDSNHDGFEIDYVWSDSSLTISKYLNAFWSRTIIQADCLPMTFAATASDLAGDTVIKFLMLTAVIAIAGAAASSQLSKSMRRKKVRKSILRSNDLAQKKAAFEANPNDSTALTNYVNAVDKYNRVGKILGWGSYDAANGWFDHASGGNSNANSNLQSIALSNSVKQFKDDFDTNSSSMIADIASILALLRAIPDYSSQIENILTRVTRIENLIR